MRYGSLIIPLFALLLTSAKYDDTFVIGPMIHLNIGNSSNKISYSIEGSYWSIKHFVGVDFGVEYEKNKIRLYTEGETGYVVVGAAIGPVEIEKGKDITLGLQGSIWANWFGGLDLRYRRINGNRFWAPGVYGKFPINTAELASGLM